MDKLFIPGDILLPKSCDMALWSVIACDQYTSQPEYWDGISEKIGTAPSTLRLILPEAYLELRDTAQDIKNIKQTMDDYLEQGIFKTLENSFIYIERKVTGGETRRGILGLIDLEHYDYSPNSASPIHSTEGTIESRLPPRVKVREGAALELPHIVVFVDDPDNRVFSGVENGEALYDFELMDGGGHIVGTRVCGEAADRVEAALAALAEPEYLKERYGLADKANVIIAMGDGNHSLATAKLCWEQLKPSLTEQERENHPARFGLTELVNIHDKSIVFEPIHRVIFDTKPEMYFAEAEDYFKKASRGSSSCHKITLAAGGKTREVSVSGLTIGEVIAAGQDFCLEYIAKHGGALDYIHDDAAALEMSGRENAVGMLLPAMDKNELFPSIMSSGAFPAKSFSIGPSRDKRYYLECRKIK